MTHIELIIISLFCLFQSIFGVGLLLLGTPTFLLMGYNYFEVLNLLLPYSIVISLLQIINTNKKNFSFMKRFLEFSVPSLIISFIFLKFFYKYINFSLIVSVILILFSILNLFISSKTIIKIKNLKLALVLLGIMHAFTNLGGSILSIIVSSITKDKNLILYNIAFGYLIFAILQLLITNLFFIELNLEMINYIWVPIITYFIARSIFLKINEGIYYKLLNFFTLIYGFYIFAGTFIKVI